MNNNATILGLANSTEIAHAAANTVMTALFRENKYPQDDLIDFFEFSVWVIFPIKHSGKLRGSLFVESMFGSDDAIGYSAMISAIAIASISYVNDTFDEGEGVINLILSRMRTLLNLLHRNTCDISTAVNPEHRLTYRFLTLPFRHQIEVAKELGVITDSLTSAELHLVLFSRAASDGQLSRLWDETEKRHKNPSSDRPFAPEHK